MENENTLHQYLVKDQYSEGDGVVHERLNIVTASDKDDAQDQYICECEAQGMITGVLKIRRIGG